jgi:glycosyltransferase involved in cell wall biosynthesis
MDSGRGAAITVVIPVWDDYVPYLQEAVDSVAPDAEAVSIVVVDNASTPPVTPPPGASVVRASRRLSVGAARNLGLDQVDTKYVVVLDADDRLLPGTLEFLRARLDTDSSVSVAATSILDSATGERHRFPRTFVPRLARWRRMFAVIDCIWSLFPIQGCALLRTAEVKEAGGYPDSDWGDDWVLAVSLAFRGRVEVHNRLGRYYRHIPESLWRRSRPRSDLVASARLVRQRVRSDPAIPTWTRTLLPAITLLQLAAVYVLQPAYLAARSARAGGRRLLGRASRGPDGRPL